MWLKSVVRTVKDIFSRYLRRKFIITVEPLAASTEQQKGGLIIVEQEIDPRVRELGDIDAELLQLRDKSSRLLRTIEALTDRRVDIVLSLQAEKSDETEEN